MTRDDMESHAREFSKSYAYDIRSGKKSSVWSTNFDAMAQKTVLKLLISKYGIMSIDMQSDHMATAIASDQAIIHKVGEEYEYADNDETPEVLEAPHEAANNKVIEQADAPLPDNIDPETGEILNNGQGEELALS